jgi:ATP-dependent Lhr-like helicase
VTLIQSSQAKEYDITVSFPPDAREKMVNGSWWPALIDAFREKIQHQRSTLLFANSRRTTEKVTRLINEASPLPLGPSHEGRVTQPPSSLPSGGAAASSFKEVGFCTLPSMGGRGEE